MIGYDGENIINITHDNPINVIDVTGAGDTVMAVFSYIYSFTKDFIFSSKVSNNLAGKSVQSIGNYKFTSEDIILCNKTIYSYQTNIIENLRKIHNFIVFTNGCFDIVHVGHLKLLKYCKSLGGILVLGLNSDSSIKNLKGEPRPINNESDRIEFIKLLDFVDYIIVFNEMTPLEIIKNIQPDIIVKGSDYCLENVIGREYSKKVLYYDLVENKSTTNIIKKIGNLNI
jgi:D-beta-D-heptose 7-phosphate kinase/D-beta-D-heptose 1-phosphate adenosyltransferase